MAAQSSQPDELSFIKPTLETRRKKRLFVCCDGTRQDGVSSRRPLTNVSRIARCIQEVSTDDYHQIVYYDSGVGNGTDWDINLRNGATGRGISDKIRNAYSFLCHNYNFGSEDDNADEIFLIGFSRGAFTVQCVASLIEHIGLLKKEGLEALPYLYRLWARQKYKGILEALRDDLETQGLLKRDVGIKACAVWDTVSALGSPLPQLLPRPLQFVGKVAPVRAHYAFQALALNEDRPHFPPLVWSKRNDPTEVRQCWFIGSHSDVGGGNDNEGLETLSLVWMIAQLETIDGCKGMFNHDILFNYMEPDFSGWKRRFQELIMKQTAAQSEFNSGISEGALVTAQYWFYYLSGRKSRGKELKNGQTVTPSEDENTSENEKTPARMKDIYATLPGRAKTTTTMKGKDAVPYRGKYWSSFKAKCERIVELPNDTQCIHFSVRLMMIQMRGYICPVLRKWETSVSGTDPISWQYRCKGAKYHIEEDKLSGVEGGILREWWGVCEKLKGDVNVGEDVLTAVLTADTMRVDQFRGDKGWTLYQLIRDNFCEEDGFETRVSKRKMYTADLGTYRRVEG